MTYTEAIVTVTHKRNVKKAAHPAAFFIFKQDPYLWIKVLTNEYIIHSTIKKMTLSPTSFESTELTEIINDQCALRTL